MSLPTSRTGALVHLFKNVLAAALSAVLASGADLTTIVGQRYAVLLFAVLTPFLTFVIHWLTGTAGTRNS